jgi:hypothetical protein
VSRRKRKEDRSPVRVERFASPAAMLDAVEAVPEYTGSRTGDSGWHGPKDWGQTVQAFGGRGCPDIGKRVGALVLNLASRLPAPPRPQWVRRPAGVLPVVPAYLAGTPAAMLDRRKIQAGPVKVVASVGASASWDPDSMAKRGAAVAALVARLAQVRPVELWISAELGAPNVVTLCRVPTSPLDVDAVGYALAGTEVFRRFMIGLQEVRQPSYDGSWTHAGDGFVTGASWTAGIRQALGLTGSDVYVPPAYGSPRGHPALEDPVRWVIDRSREVGQ